MLEDNKTWIELTRRKEHMKHKDGLDQEKLRLLSFDTMPENQSLEALITEVAPNAKHSSPISIQVSPFVHSQLLFSDCINTKLLPAKADIGKFINFKYKVG